MQAKMRTMESLRLNENIEDVLITLGKQYHLIRLLKNLPPDTPGAPGRQRKSIRGFGAACRGG
jgi:hypothetical protein